MRQVRRNVQTMGEVFALSRELGTPEDLARARRTVAAAARDTEDCRFLLEALGLLEGDGTVDVAS